MWCIYAAKMVTVSHLPPSYCANTIGRMDRRLAFLCPLPTAPSATAGGQLQNTRLKIIEDRGENDRNCTVVTGKVAQNGDWISFYMGLQIIEINPLTCGSWAKYISRKCFMLIDLVVSSTQRND